MKIQYFAYLIILLFFAMDFIIRKDSSAKSMNKTKEDNSSTKIIVLTFFIVLISAEILTFIHDGQFNNMIVSIVALILMISGLLTRIYSMRKLKKSYTRILKTTEHQKLIASGLYGIIRHSGYLGTILIWFSFGFAIENYIVVIIAILMTSIAYSYRIKKEERMLLNQFGQEYADYQKKTWRIIPFIW